MKLILRGRKFGFQLEEIRQWLLIYENEGTKAQMKAWGDFVRRIHETQDGEGTLLDHTMMLLTSNLGNASAHDTKNMPVVFAGGGFNHGQHLAFDRQNNYPLPNLYTSMLQRLDLEVDTFASATGTMQGLEMS
jgi:DNA-binding transcriptional MerR regulator